MIHPTNRFLVYALYPKQNISIWIVNGLRNQNCVFACGHSILNRTCTSDIGSLMLRYGGGGHRTVGTCQVAHEDAQGVLTEVVAVLNARGEGRESPSRAAVTVA